MESAVRLKNWAKMNKMQSRGHSILHKFSLSDTAAGENFDMKCTSVNFVLGVFL